MINGYLLDEKGRFEHRKIFFKESGQKYRKGWHIHHIDGIKTNNDISNLIYLPKRIHIFIHERYGFTVETLPSREILEYGLGDDLQKLTPKKLRMIENRILHKMGFGNYKKLKKHKKPIKKVKKKKTKKVKQEKLASPEDQKKILSEIKKSLDQ